MIFWSPPLPSPVLVYLHITVLYYNLKTMHLGGSVRKALKVQVFAGLQSGRRGRPPVLTLTYFCACVAPNK